VVTSWLSTSGHGPKVKAASLAMPAAWLCFLLAIWASSERTPARVRLFLLLVPLASLLSLTPLLLNPLVRCRVCGLRLWGCQAARSLPRSSRQQWLETLEACPACGDDGRATHDSRARWLASGAEGEIPYWTKRRVTIAVLLALLIAGGGFYRGASYGVPARSHPAGGRALR
jgi:hypothetical protein